MITLDDRNPNDFDASLIGSLSLDDSTKFETVNTHFEDQQDEDMMEIDDTLDIYESNETHNGVSHTPEPESSEGSRNITPLNKLSHFIASPFQSTPIHSIREEHSGQQSDGSDRPYSDGMGTESKKYGGVGDDTDIENRDESYGYVDHSDLDRDQSTMSSFSKSILSPTSLGAQFAVRGPKLLLDAPYNSQETDNEHYDHEYDTSSFSSTPAGEISGASRREYDYASLRNRDSKVRNSSSFLSSSDASPFFADDKPDYATNRDYNNSYRYDDSLSGNSLENNSMSQSFYYRKQHHALKNYNSFENSRVMDSSPVHIHHHHYYSNFGTPKASPENLSMSIENRSFQHPDQPLYTDMVPYMPSDQDVKLPLPWKASSSPHERVPYMLSSYIQLLVNVLATGYGFYLIVSIVSVIKGDISNKLHQHSTNMMVEIASCKRSYEENNCSPDQIVPALERSCAHWLKCMSQDPFKGGNTSSVSAETLGVIINSLVEPLGYKFFLMSFAFVMLVFVCNFFFGYVRAKAYYGWSSPRSGHVPSQSPSQAYQTSPSHSLPMVPPST